MHQLEVFFDYACPYCLKGHEYLKVLRLSFPGIEIVWRPCESHPRPERYGRHSDLCIRGMFFAQDRNADLWAYHEIMYNAAVRDRLDIENLDVLAECVRGLLDADAFQKSLQNGEYVKELADANSRAYDLSGVWAVPSYRMNGRKLDSIEDIGVSKKQLAHFMDMENKLSLG